MKAEISAENFSVSPSGGEIPTITLQELEADPHGVFGAYRKKYPVVMHEIGGYFVLRFSDVDCLSKDPRFRPSGTSFPEMQGFGSGTIFDAFDYGMLTADGDVHRRRRAPFSRLFAARAINEMRPSIRRTAEDLLEDWYRVGEIDFFGEFAAKLPARVIADLLRLARTSRSLRCWSMR